MSKKEKRTRNAIVTRVSGNTIWAETTTIGGGTGYRHLVRRDRATLRVSGSRVIWEATSEVGAIELPNKGDEIRIRLPAGSSSNWGEPTLWVLAEEHEKALQEVADVRAARKPSQGNRLRGRRG